MAASRVNVIQDIDLEGFCSCGAPDSAQPAPRTQVMVLSDEILREVKVGPRTPAMFFDKEMLDIAAESDDEDDFSICGSDGLDSDGTESTGYEELMSPSTSFSSTGSADLVGGDDPPSTESPNSPTRTTIATIHSDGAAESGATATMIYTQPVRPATADARAKTRPRRHHAELLVCAFPSEGAARSEHQNGTAATESRPPATVPSSEEGASLQRTATAPAVDAPNRHVRRYYADAANARIPRRSATCAGGVLLAHTEPAIRSNAVKLEPLNVDKATDLQLKNFSMPLRSPTTPRRSFGRRPRTLRSLSQACDVDA